MKVLVVGTGSIGKRHISNLKLLGAEVVAYSYRFAMGRSIEQIDEVAVILDSLDNAKDVDAVIIANRSDLHMEIALWAARLGKHLFIEKPLSVSLSGTNELLALVHKNNLIVEAGYMLRFHPNIIWIKKRLEEGFLGDIISVQASVGQWLPNWRPGTDHRRCYSAMKDHGGGVIFDLIHELDLFYWLFGPVKKISAMTRKVNSLGIETEAVAQIGLLSNSGILAQIHMDYVRAAYERELKIVGSSGVIKWDYVTGTVLLSRHDKSNEIVHRTVDNFERNCMFFDHMNHFLKRINNPDLPAASSLIDSINVLSIALACHESSNSKKFVELF